MANIDWHSHHTAPEVSERIKELTGKRPHIDALDSPDFSKRIREMDEAGVDLQLICQGAGVYADQMPAGTSAGNRAQVERRLGRADRAAQRSLDGRHCFVAEKYRRVGGGNRTDGGKQGFRAVLLYPHVEGKMLVDTPAMDPIFAKISELNLPIFLHGAGTAQEPVVGAARRWRCGSCLCRTV